MKKSLIVVPTDFSEASLVGVRTARVIAGQLGAEIALIHCWDRDALCGPNATLDWIQVDQARLENDIRESITTSLEKVRAEELSDMQVTIGLVHDRSAARGVCSYAHEQNADVIVLSTHGRTGVERILVGSVAEKVVRLASCPVVTVPIRSSGSEERKVA